MTCESGQISKADEEGEGGANETFMKTCFAAQSTYLHLSAGIQNIILTFALLFSLFHFPLKTRPDSLYLWITRRFLYHSFRTVIFLFYPHSLFRSDRNQALISNLEG